MLSKSLFELLLYTNGKNFNLKKKRFIKKIDRFAYYIIKKILKNMLKYYLQFKIYTRKCPKNRQIAKYKKKVISYKLSGSTSCLFGTK